MHHIYLTLHATLCILHATCTHIRSDDITVNSIKANTKSSLSDVALQQFKLLPYLLGPWLDAKPIAQHIKGDIRRLFASRESYRNLYNPIVGQADVTFMLSWPKGGKMLVDFIESVAFNPSSTEEHQLRQAMRNGRNAEETLSYSPWCDMNQDVNQELSRTTICNGNDATPTTTGAAPTDSNNAAPVKIADEDDDDDNRDTSLNDDLHTAAKKLLRQLVFLAVEPSTQQGLVDLFRASPLGRVTWTRETGNVLLLMDLNVYGESSSRPDVRKVPVPRQKFERFIKSALEARAGDQEPQHLAKGDIFACIDAGKERRSHFLKPFGSMLKNKSKDAPNRSSVRKIVLHFNEEAFQARRRRTRGQVRLTQCIHVVSNVKTDIPHRFYKTHDNSNQCDLLGPVKMDALADLPTMHQTYKNSLLGQAEGSCGRPLRRKRRRRRAR